MLWAIFPWMIDAIDEPNEIALWTIIVSTGIWAFKTWWKQRLENKHKKRVEGRLEKEWSNGDDTLSGTKNPGRTQAQLIEIVHEDLQEHKKTSGRKFDKIIEDVGKIKGKLGIN